jgi:hypothetical protein
LLLDVAGIRFHHKTHKEDVQSITLFLDLI